MTIQQAVTDLNNLMRVRIEDTCTDCAAITNNLGCDGMTRRLRGIAAAANGAYSDFTPVISALHELEFNSTLRDIPDVLEKIKMLREWLETVLLDFCNKVIERAQKV